VSDVSEHQHDVVLAVTERVKVVAATTVSVAAMIGVLIGFWAILNRGAQAAQKADVSRLEAVDSQIIAREDQTDQRINRLISVVEINSTLMVEPKGSVDYALAVSKLRSMRRIVSH